MLRLLFPRILDRYLAGEVWHAFLGVSVVLLLVVLGNLFVRLLGQAAEGRIPEDLIPTLLLLASFKGLILLIPVALFLGILLSLGRLYSDSEMTAIRASGAGYGRVLRPVLVLASLVGVVLAFMVFEVVPRIQHVKEEIRLTSSQRLDIFGITPGRFVSDPAGDRVIYAREIVEEGRELQGLFISARAPDGRDVVITAERAVRFEDSRTGDRYLLLLNGMRYEGRVESGPVTRTWFERHGILLRGQGDAGGHRGLDALPLSELLQGESPRHVAELQWRLSFPISAILLALLAVPLAHQRPRQGRYARLAVAVVIYGLYANLLVTARTWIVREEIGAWPGLWWVHASLLLGVVLLFVQRHGARWLWYRLRGGGA